MAKKINPKDVASEFEKIERRCRGQRPATIEPGSPIAVRLEKRHHITVTKTLDVAAELSRLLNSDDLSLAKKFDRAVRQEWCQVNLGSPKCNENISKIASALIAEGKVGLDGLDFQITCPRCGCVSTHRISLPA